MNFFTYFPSAHLKNKIHLFAEYVCTTRSVLPVASVFIEHQVTRNVVIPVIVYRITLVENPTTLHLKILTHFEGQLHEMVMLKEEIYLALYPQLVGMLASCIEIIRAFPHPISTDKEQALNELRLLHLNILEFEPQRVYTAGETSLPDAYIEWVRIVAKAERALQIYVKTLL